MVFSVFGLRVIAQQHVESRLAALVGSTVAQTRLRARTGLNVLPGSTSAVGGRPDV